MLPKKVTDLYSSLISTAGLFRSPAYKTFFSRKAEDDLEELKIVSNNGQKPCKIEEYMAEQKDLLDTLKRQTVIFNMFYDDKSRI